jgi:hypothetical protein
MIKKIISGGQTGVDRAALDAATKLAIPHGGWIPKGRLTENGPLPPEYHLTETLSSSYADRTEKNVLAADGTLIISRGPLTGGSQYTLEMAVKHNRHWLHIDLNQTAAFQAANVISDWIRKNEIAILNVAGPRASKDPAIYRDTMGILESTYYLGLIQGDMAGTDQSSHPAPGTSNRPTLKPQTIEAAVDQLIPQMSLKDKTMIANMSQDELPNLYLNLGNYIMDNFGLLSGNHKLMESCRTKADGDFQHEEDAVAVIIKALWEKLRLTFRLRVIK